MPPVKLPLPKKHPLVVEALIDSAPQSDADPREIRRLKTVKAFGNKVKALKAEKAQRE